MNEAAQIDESPPDLSKLFPAGDAQRFARAGFEVVYRLAEMLEALSLDEGTGLNGRIDEINERLDDASEKLVALNEKLDFYLKTLSSFALRNDPSNEPVE